MMVEKGTMPVGDLFSFIIYTGIIGGAIAGLGNLYTALAGSIGATERIQDILDRHQEINIADHQSIEELRFKGDVSFDDVSFSYPGRPEFQVLKHIQFDISSGQRIALVGASGAGKSTLIQLLMRFYNTDNGVIKVDGKPVSDYNLTAFRKIWQ